MEHTANEVIAGRFAVQRMVRRDGKHFFYDAVERETGRKVAIKQWLQSDAAAREALEAEAAALGRLHNAHLPRVLDKLVLDPPAYYLVTELVDGVPLTAVRRYESRPDEDAIRDIALQLLRVLEFLSAQQPPQVHGHIDPEHVMRRADGRVYLLGVGACAPEPDSAFAPPERAAAAGAATPASDLYAAAACFAFLVTGRSPRQLRHSRGGVDLTGYGVSNELQALLERMLQDNPLGRHASASAALHELRKPRARPRLTFTVHVPLTLAAVLSAVWFAVSAPIGMRMNPYRGKLVMSSADDVKRPILDTAFTPQPRALRGALRLRRVHALQGHWSAVFDVGFDDKARRIASASNDGSVRLWSTSHGRALHVLAGHEGPAAAVRFLPDGRLVSAGGTSVRVWSAEGVLEQTWQADAKQVTTLAVAPDSRTVYAAGLEGQVKGFELGSDRARLSLGQAGRVLTLAVDARGKRLAVAGDDGVIRVHRLPDGALEQSLSGHRGPVAEVRFSPDGQTLVSAGDDQTVRVWFVERGQLLHTLQGHLDQVWAVALDPAGKCLASGGKDGELRIWDLYTGALELSQAADACGILALAFSPDGQRLAVGGGSQGVDLFELRNVQPTWRPPPVPSPVLRAAPQAPEGSPPELERIYEARELMRGGNVHDDYGRALELLRRVQRDRPDYALVYVELARVTYKAGYLQRDQYRPDALERAHALLRRAAELDPDLYDLHLRLAYLLHFKKDNAGARQEAARAERIKPGDPQTQLVLSAIAADDGNDDEVVQHARAVIEAGAEPELLSQAYATLGEVYRTRGEWEAADEIYRSEINLDPQSAWAKGNYADFLVGRGRHDEAIVWAQGALAQWDYGAARGTLSDAYARKALAALRRNDEKSCAALLDQADRVHPGRADLHYTRGQVHRHKGDEMRAAEEFQAALRDDPDHAGAKQALAEPSRP